MKPHTGRTVTIVVLAIAMAWAVHAQPQSTRTAPTEDHGAMMKRGDQAMGFSHEKTTHHFRLFKDGGAIEVTANDPKDLASRDEIRQHLSHITRMFAAGNFNVPMLIHGTTPPGVPTMKELHDQIRYVFQEMDSGARIRINTSNPQAVEAIHSFLRFQIAEHQTGDTTEAAIRDTGHGRLFFPKTYGPWGNSSRLTGISGTRRYGHESRIRAAKEVSQRQPKKSAV